jgi:hypothetical protein
MKLFKFEIERGRKGKDVVVHAEDEDAARARVAKKYTGWTVRGEIHEVAGEAHFVLADLEDEDPSPTPAPALDRAIEMLRRVEFSVDTHERTGKDTLGCPMCNGGTIVGLHGEHDADCELAALLRDLDAL